MGANVYVGLVHYPIYNKHKEIVTTAVTNYDIHDIARAARTYDISRYFIIHNRESQRELVERVLEHWRTGFGSSYNPDRKEAFEELVLVESIEAAIAEVVRLEGGKPLIVTTDARVYDHTITYAFLREQIQCQTRPVLILFGTGYGMTKEVMQYFDYILEPIFGHSSYNHLSVRSAVSVILDRLRGEAWWEKS